MPNQSRSLDDAFHALGDPTRRAVVSRLCRGPASVGELAAPFKMALPSFLQHLRVLEDCGLVTSIKVGRVRTCRVNLKPLNALEKWVAEQRLMWERRLDQFDAFVTALHKKEQETDR
jgi:DNA-binding transcriptional ArsR family regulator